MPVNGTPRRPLFQPTQEERVRRLRELGQELDGDSPVPLGLTPEEKQAAAHPGLPDKRWKEAPVDPLVPPVLQKIAAALAVVLGAAASFVATLGLPPWVGVALWALTYVAALLAGVALPAFKDGSPAVPVALVPTLLSISGGLVAWGSTLQPGWLQSGVLFLGALLSALAGKAMPQPVKA